MRPPHGVETTGVRVAPEVWTVNRIQALVLGFFAVVLAILVGILTLAPDVYDAALQLPADVRLAEIGVWGPRPGGVDNRRPAS